MHKGGSNWLMADGSVRFVGYAGADVLTAMSTRSGREVIRLPD